MASVGKNVTFDGEEERFEVNIFDFDEDIYVADGGVACGLPRDKALAYAAKMAEGTARLMLENHAHPGQLKDGVCSPGGTTIQGVRTLEDRGFRSAVIEAVIAAYEKTIALGK